MGTLAATENFQIVGDRGLRDAKQIGDFGLAESLHCVELMFKIAALSNRKRSRVKARELLQRTIGLHARGKNVAVGFADMSDRNTSATPNNVGIAVRINVKVDWNTRLRLKGIALLWKNGIAGGDFEGGHTNSWVNSSKLMNLMNPIMWERRVNP
ncbi:hypothetical protein D7U76_11225 [Stenotrophomonas maltophilia]|nr:hypothetical protein [Stenotrophomonas maltophilia]